MLIIFKGRILGPQLFLVPNCFRENAIVTCKIIVCVWGGGWGGVCVGVYVAVVQINFFCKMLLFVFFFEIKPKNGAHSKKDYF